MDTSGKPKYGIQKKMKIISGNYAGIDPKTHIILVSHVLHVYKMDKEYAEENGLMKLLTNDNDESSDELITIDLDNIPNSKYIMKYLEDNEINEVDKKGINKDTHIIIQYRKPVDEYVVSLNNAILSKFIYEIFYMEVHGEIIKLYKDHELGIISLTHIENDVMVHIIKWMERFGNTDNKPSEFNQPLEKDLKESLSDWEKEFVYDDLNKGNDKPGKILFDVLEAANFIGIKCLFKLMGAAIANFIRDKDVKKMRDILDIENDWSKEEFERLTTENTWIS